jgi:hypothetical protein
MSTIFNVMKFLYIIAVLLIVLIFVYNVKAIEPFVDASNIIANMNETSARRSQFASALLAYDPRIVKYQDPRLYDFHTCGNATQFWKNDFQTFLSTIADDVVTRVLSYKNVIVLFDAADLLGNVIFVPITENFPIVIDDQVMTSKYIKWEPPSNIISAIVPAGLKIRFDFSNSSSPDYIYDGITSSFFLTRPIAKIQVEKIVHKV